MTIAGLTDGTVRGGLYRGLGPVEDAVNELEEAGWRVGVADEATTTSEFYDAIAVALDFPDWFGRNLDALWDCLTDLTGPTALLVHRWSTYATSRPERWARIEEILIERARQDPPFAVVLL